MPSIPPQPFVSVVIPHRGEDSPLELCLEGLRHQTYPQHLYEILIVLNEPNRRFLEFEIQEGEFPLWEPQYFSYSARNHGVENSKGDVIAFTDSDTIPSREWISEGVKALMESGADLVAGHITVTTSTARPTAAALYELMYAFDQEKNVGGGFSTTANLFAKRHMFAEYGLFEESASTGEDFEWTRSVANGGAKLVYAPAARVSHPARESWSALLAKARRTTLPYVGIAEGASDNSERLRARLQFQLSAKPSPSRINTLSSPQKFIARLVRVALMAYKALCLLRIPPAFQRDLQVARTKGAPQALTVQGASA